MSRHSWGTGLLCREPAGGQRGVWGWICTWEASLPLLGGLLCQQIGTYITAGTSVDTTAGNLTTVIEMLCRLE